MTGRSWAKVDRPVYLGVHRRVYRQHVKVTDIMVDRIVGFIGLGLMGEPMARNLVRSGVPAIVWNRSIEKCAALAADGANVAPSVDDVFAQAATVMLMLADDRAIDAVLGRGTQAFASRVARRTIVQMGTVSAAFSKKLEAEIAAAGGWYVEAPVSGSRKPAEDAQLVAMVAGDPEAVARIEPFLNSMCRDVVYCGAVPHAALMKFAVNVFLITMVTGLAEAVSFAQQHALDLDALRRVLDGGPMSSSVSRAKLEKLMSGDLCAAAAIFDVLKNTRLIAEAARDAGLASPLLDTCHQLFAQTFDLGFARDDMIAVIRAIEARHPSLQAATQ